MKRFWKSIRFWAEDMLALVSLCLFFFVLLVWFSALAA